MDTDAEHMSQAGAAVTTVTPGAASASAPADLIAVEETLHFSGRFPFGIDQWAYVPFDVPPGTRRITVTTTHARWPVSSRLRP